MTDVLTPSTMRPLSPPVRHAARQRASWRDDMVTIGGGFWLVAGLFIDGWAHNTRTLVESFFTPWHAIFYSGFTACAAWICWLALRGRRAGRTGIAAIPIGYEWSLLGVLIFGAGGIGDLLWHVAFGIERNLAALLSPTHLLLMVGATLLLTSPLRAAWADPDPASIAPTLRTFLPALLSMAAATVVVAFIGAYFAALIDDYFAAAGPNRTQELGIEGILLSNVVLMAPILLLLRRWRPPFGSVTITFTLHAVLINAFASFDFAPTILGALLAGLVADLLILAWRPGPSRPGALRWFAAAVPIVYWGLYFLIGQLSLGVRWPPELWAGVIVLSALASVGLSFLAVPLALAPMVEARLQGEQ